MAFYSEAQRDLQAKFDTTSLADRLEMAIVTPEIDEPTTNFIQSRDFFFLSSVNGDGSPTVSYKGGAPGLVSVVDSSTLAFPNYDGNGMYFSMGNIQDTAKIGLLFIDFETPQRVRIQADATVSADDPLLGSYPGANLIVRASITEAFINCARYIHRHERQATSPYVPDDNGEAPMPSWKRIDAMQDVLPTDVQEKVSEAGGPITMEDYGDRLGKGIS